MIVSCRFGGIMKSRLAFLFACAALVLTVASCDEGLKGPANQNVEVSSAAAAAAAPLKVSGAYINATGQPVVSFTLVDNSGAPITSLCGSYPCQAPRNVVFGIIKLVPGRDSCRTSW